MTAPPLTFEDRKDGRTVALLGAHEIAEIYPIEPTGPAPLAAGHLKAAYRCALPPISGPVLVRNTDAAKQMLRRHVERWLRIAGLHESQVG